MSATLQDVARMAGVHASTVSRVLSGKASIRSETRDRIFAAIRQLDYHPNSNARSLAGGHTGVLALVLDMNRSDPYGGIFESDSQFSLEKEAYRRHCHMMLVSPDAVHELVKEQRIDGLLATPAAAKELALPKNFPCVLLGQPDQPTPTSAGWTMICCLARRWRLTIYAISTMPPFLFWESAVMGPAAFTGAWRAIVSPFLPEYLPVFSLPTARLPAPGKSFPPVWVSWNGPMLFSAETIWRPAVFCRHCRARALQCRTISASSPSTIDPWRSIWLPRCPFFGWMANASARKSSECWWSGSTARLYRRSSC